MVPIEIQDCQESEDEKQADCHNHPKVNFGGAATGIKFWFPIAFLVYGHIPIDHHGVPVFLPAVQRSLQFGAMPVFSRTSLEDISRCESAKWVHSRLILSDPSYSSVPPTHGVTGSSPVASTISLNFLSRSVIR